MSTREGISRRAVLRSHEAVTTRAAQAVTHAEQVTALVQLRLNVIEATLGHLNTRVQCLQVDQTETDTLIHRGSRWSRLRWLLTGRLR